MKKITFLSVLLTIFALVQVHASPFTLVGERYARVQIGGLEPDDSFLQSIDNRLFHVDATINVPVGEGLDFQLHYEHFEAKGAGSFAGVPFSIESTMNVLMAGAVWYMNTPTMGVYSEPLFFVRTMGGIAWADAVAASSVSGAVSNNETDFVGDLALGVDFEILDGTSFVPVFGYELTGSGAFDDSFYIGAGLNQKIGEMLLLSVNAKYRFNEGGLEVNGGAGILF